MLLTRRNDNGGTKHLWNVGILLPDYTAQQPRRQQSYNKCEHVDSVFSLRVKLKQLCEITYIL
jgi:hypothetical protein